MVDIDISRTEIYNIIDEWVHNERDRAILKRRLTDGITYDRLAEEFDLSVPQVKRIIYKGQERVFKHVLK